MRDLHTVCITYFERDPAKSILSLDVECRPRISTLDVTNLDSALLVSLRNDNFRPVPGGKVLFSSVARFRDFAVFKRG